MSKPHERVLRGAIQSDHFVQLFDDDHSLVESVSTFLLDGWQSGEPLLVVARPQHWLRTSRRLTADGLNVEEAVLSGRLTVLDAATTLAAFLRNGRPVAGLFHDSVGTLVRRVGEESGKSVRVYGEMVDVLASQGEFAAAQELENLWNNLASKVSFKLLCGYAAAHFADPRTASALHAICDVHHHASANPADLLACWLLADRRPRFHQLVD